MTHQGLGEFEQLGSSPSFICAAKPARRGGEGPRYVRIESTGRRARREARQRAERMWRGLNPASWESR